MLIINVPRHEKSKAELFEVRNENNSSDAHLISWRNAVSRFDQMIDGSQGREDFLWRAFKQSHPTEQRPGLEARTISNQGSYVVSADNTVPRQESNCMCARMCTCACHSLPGIRHMEPCCGPHSRTHAMFCRNHVECLTKS